MQTLSIIIVNYNSKHLLQKCLASVFNAGKQINYEVIIVDNNSNDGIGKELHLLYPQVKLIINNSNLGFAKACNQGYKISEGKYLLFLNPDTILSENCIRDCINFFESNSNAGAVGVRMVNDKGVYLKESKRGLPTPSASFFKLFGLSTLFPRSQLFAGYYLGHLTEFENNQVKILSGAFMMVRREAFEKTGGYDERFFMYGEDVDLSLRIAQIGFENFYLGTITIVHIKGGSTTYNKKYIEDFYGSMKLYVSKHYANHSKFYRSLLNTGIDIRKMMTKIRLFFR